MWDLPYSTYYNCICIQTKKAVGGHSNPYSISYRSRRENRKDAMVQCIVQLPTPSCTKFPGLHTGNTPEYTQYVENWKKVPYEQYKFINLVSLVKTTFNIYFCSSTISQAMFFNIQQNSEPALGPCFKDFKKILLIHSLKLQSLYLWQ